MLDATTRLQRTSGENDCRDADDDERGSDHALTTREQPRREKAGVVIASREL